MVKLLKLATMAALAVLSFGAAGASTASAGFCTAHGHLAYGSSRPSRVAAMRHAKRNWSRIVSRHDGRRYARWSVARHKRVRLFRVGRFRWRALVRARPCMGPGGFTAR